MGVHHAGMTHDTQAPCHLVYVVLGCLFHGAQFSKKRRGKMSKQ